jgi:hypothetical protein
MSSAKSCGGGSRTPWRSCRRRIGSDLLRHFAQLSVADVAAVLEVPEGTVESRHFRALERLQRLLGEEVES